MNLTNEIKRIWLRIEAAVKGATPAGEAHLGSIGGYTVPIQATLTRPADTDAYTALDCIADKTSGASAIEFANAGRKTGGTGYITGLRFETDQAANVSEYNLHIFREAPGTVIQDNAVWNAVTADKAIRVGTINIPAIAKVGASGTSALKEITGLKLPYKCTATSLFAQLETVTGFTPASAQAFLIEPIFDQN
ncbi:hypothetical protein LCGC14_2896780 [marine sediment metagenome]|uniref:Uncharacterized protein n=1 Tax=marine sediment metagenome TaxID=412755 RepID=A0A0F8YHE7_9ZZZZ